MDENEFREWKEILLFIKGHFDEFNFANIEITKEPKFPTFLNLHFFCFKLKMTFTSEPDVNLSCFSPSCTHSNMTKFCWIDFLVNFSLSLKIKTDSNRYWDFSLNLMGGRTSLFSINQIIFFVFYIMPQTCRTGLTPFFYYTSNDSRIFKEERNCTVEKKINWKKYIFIEEVKTFWFFKNISPKNGNKFSVSKVFTSKSFAWNQLKVWKAFGRWTWCELNFPLINKIFGK